MKPLKPLKDYSPVKVGLVGAAVVGALIAGSTAFGTLGLADARYEAEIAHVGGVQPGDEVRVAGIGVGQVTRTRLAGDRVVMSFRAERDVHLGERTRLTVKLSTLLGGRYVELSPRGDGELPDWRIPLAQTDVPFDLQAALEAGTPALEKLDGKKLRTALADATDVFRDLDPKVVASTFDGLSELSEVIRGREDQIAALLDSADAVTKTLNANSARLFGLMDRSDRLLRQLVQRRTLIRSLLADFRELTKQLSGMLVENREQIGPLMRNLESITGILADNDKAIDRSLELLAPTARYLANATGNGPYLELDLPYGIFADNMLCTTGAVRGCR